MTIKEVKVEPLKRQFPHVDTIEDWRAQQSIRLLWDRLFDVEGRLQAAEASLREAIAAVNTQEAQLANVAQKADAALAEAQLSRAEKEAGAAEGLKDDHGLGLAGCAAAGSDGHLGTPGAALHVLSPEELTLENVGKIICGVGNEFPSLLVATATLAARQANADELLDRMVWHLNQQGFAAARYPTTEGRPWHILFDALSPTGESPVRQQSYRVVSYYPLPPEPWDPTNVLEVSMFSYGGQSPGVTTTPETGIAD